MNVRSIMCDVCNAAVVSNDPAKVDWVHVKSSKHGAASDFCPNCVNKLSKIFRDSAGFINKFPCNFVRRVMIDSITCITKEN